VLDILQGVVAELSAAVLDACHQEAQAIVITGLDSKLEVFFGILAEVLREGLLEELVDVHAVVNLVLEVLVGLFTPVLGNTVEQVVKLGIA
jgi:hypothetical protein